ncbi:hypothetical protein HK097_000856 [Rhizophlyctis rosea]|uniref:Uncharacterized protein n=1 Tax=Rhizophlyctis rosea TaxID=64517 RepID=A0AAD5S7M4_9FUNG|nr:hypothetical protein HK097_000856 [Rhizophlyctis rosea]
MNNIATALAYRQNTPPPTLYTHLLSTLQTPSSPHATHLALSLVNIAPTSYPWCDIGTDLPVLVPVSKFDDTEANFVCKGVGPIEQGNNMEEGEKKKKRKKCRVGFKGEEFEKLIFELQTAVGSGDEKEPVKKTIHVPHATQTHRKVDESDYIGVWQLVTSFGALPTSISTLGTLLHIIDENGGWIWTEREGMCVGKVEAMPELVREEGEEKGKDNALLTPPNTTPPDVNFAFILKPAEESAERNVLARAELFLKGRSARVAILKVGFVCGGEVVMVLRKMTVVEEGGGGKRMVVDEENESFGLGDGAMVSERASDVEMAGDGQNAEVGKVLQCEDACGGVSVFSSKVYTRSSSGEKVNETGDNDVGKQSEIIEDQDDRIIIHTIPETTAQNRSNETEANVDGHERPSLPAPLNETTDSGVGVNEKSVGEMSEKKKQKKKRKRKRQQSEHVIDAGASKDTAEPPAKHFRFTETSPTPDIPISPPISPHQSPPASTLKETTPEPQTPPQTETAPPLPETPVAPIRVKSAPSPNVTPLPKVAEDRAAPKEHSSKKQHKVEVDIPQIKRRKTEDEKLEEWIHKEVLEFLESLEPEAVPNHTRRSIRQEMERRCGKSLEHKRQSISNAVKEWYGQPGSLNGGG